MATFGAFVLLSSLIAAAIVWRGYVVAILWGWFVSTTFGLAPLTTIQAIGLVVVVSAVWMRRGDSNDDRALSDRALTMVGELLVAPLVMLGMGWIVKGFMA